jgi:hypothetical protein
MFVKVKPSGAAKKIGRADASKPFYAVLKNSRALGIARRLADGKLDVLHGPSLSQVFDGVRGDVLRRRRGRAAGAVARRHALPPRQEVSTGGLSDAPRQSANACSPPSPPPWAASTASPRPRTSATFL